MAVASSPLVQGAQTFREVGGYRTRDGRFLRRGRLWRSARLDQLTADDCAVIAALGIRQIADLRGSEERRQWPTNPLLFEQANVLSWDLEGPTEEAAPSSRLQTFSGDFSAARNTMLQVYPKIAEDQVPRLSGLYRAIANANTPILIHCAAGKDRTGVAIGLLLDLVGIERSAILADYEVSERHLDWSRLDLAATLGVTQRASETDIPTALLDAIIRSDRAYLESVFTDIEQRFNSTESFVESRLGLSQAAIASIRRHLLED